MYGLLCLYSIVCSSSKKRLLDIAYQSEKNKNKPKVLKMVGKTDKLIKDYLEIYE